MNRKLVLENGQVFEGIGFGSNNQKIAELVFNTSMVGYQEILSDPSYCEQMVCMTYPLIGNYGLADDDYESKNIYLSALIVKEYNDLPSNFRSTKTLNQAMQNANVAGIAGIDTRQLTRVLRDHGAMKALVCDIDKPIEECLETLNNYQYPTNQIQTVSTKKIWSSKIDNPLYTVVALDCGIKLNIIKKLNEHQCNVIVVPYHTTAQEILDLKPNGLFLSNGPGDPQNANSPIELIKRIKGQLPILGICLGHQLVALAYGAQTYKMKFGHRGANHPVKDLTTNKIEITSQNHSYAIDQNSLKNTTLNLTHINLLDNEAEGLTHIDDNIITVQYHPESAAGPEDSTYIFNRFIKLMQQFKGE